MVCEVCGKELAEGEVCGCQKNAADTVSDDADSTLGDAAQEFDSNEEAQSAEADNSSSLPQADEVAAMAKNVADSIVKNPIVSEFVRLIKGAVLNPVKTTVKSAQRTDILWIIAGIAELLVSAVAANMMLRRGIFSIISATLNPLYDLPYSEYSEALGEINLGIWSTYGVFLLCGLITFVVAMILIFLSVLLFKKHTSISSVANMLTTAYMPSAILLTVSIITSLIYVPISLALGLAAIFSFVILGYLGMQKLDKFTKSPFAVYLLCAVIIIIVYFVCFSKISVGALGELFDTLVY